MFEYTNIFVSIFMLGFRFDVICWYFDAWYNNKESHLPLYINLCVNNLSHLTFVLFGTLVRFFLLNIFVSKNDTNEYPNVFVLKELYEWISEYSSHPVSRPSGKFPDHPKGFQTIWKVSRSSKRFPNHLESFQTNWKVSRLSGKFPVYLDSYLAI